MKNYTRNAALRSGQEWEQACPSRPCSSHTCAGFLYGWMKGLREKQHLAGKYGKDSVYRGVVAVFR